ncbi:MAG: hypothetical protein MZU79_07450 [Anaerotruncus sp.]|nr:hypothetical protein [Anaerotruncus sp.]
MRADQWRSTCGSDEGPVEAPGRGPAPGSSWRSSGPFFLIALLSVPVTTTTSRTRQDEGSNLVVRTTYPRRGHDVPAPVSLVRARPPKAGTAVRVRATQWWRDDGHRRSSWGSSTTSSSAACSAWGDGQRRTRADSGEPLA